MRIPEHECWLLCVPYAHAPLWYPQALPWEMITYILDKIYLVNTTHLTTVSNSVYTVVNSYWIINEHKTPNKYKLGRATWRIHDASQLYSDVQVAVKAISVVSTHPLLSQQRLHRCKGKVPFSLGGAMAALGIGLVPTWERADTHPHKCIDRWIYRQIDKKLHR